MQRSPTATNAIESTVAVVAPTASPLEATILLPETLTEGYSEIRAVETGEVVTAIEILPPKIVGRLQYETKTQGLRP